MTSKRNALSANVLVFLVIGIVIGAAAVYAYMSSLAPNVVTSTISPAAVEYKIGATLPLTGELSSIGTQWKTVIEMALDELNSQSTIHGMNVKFSLVELDDKTTPEGALKNVQSLYQSGMGVIIGPAGSSQAKAVKSYVDENKIVMLSPSSTAPTLAIPDDYIYRTVGSDVGQAAALAKMVASQKSLSGSPIDTVVLFHRDDDYGIAFADFFTKEFAKYGGKAEDLKYAVGQADYASEVAQLSSKVTSSQADGVVIITYDTDGTNILSHAKDDAILSKVRWFSSEGIQGTKELLNEPIGKFAQIVSLYGTRPLFRENPNYVAFVEQYKAKTGSDPPVFSANIYDAIIIAGNAILDLGGQNDGAALAAAIVNFANTYNGVSGPMAFDANGDKAAQDYGIWTIAPSGSTYVYQDIGSYSGGTLTLD